MVTISDVAALAGVSVSTVSRVLNGAAVSDTTREAVHAATRRLRYIPSRAARVLRGQSSRMIGLLIPDVQEPHFAELARGAEDLASRQGYSLMLCNTDHQLTKESAFLQRAVSERVAGVIISPVADSTSIDEAVSHGLRIVAVDRETALDVDTVVMPNTAAGHAATTSLKRAGYQRIGCIAGPRSVEAERLRAMAWSRAVATYPPADQRALLRHVTNDVSGGRAAMEELLALEVPPDAVVAGNDLVAAGALQVITENQLAPAAFGVAVIGTLAYTTLSPGMLTHVHLPARTMGTVAARMLIERIEGHDTPARTLRLDLRLRRGDEAMPRHSDNIA